MQNPSRGRLAAVYVIALPWSKRTDFESRPAGIANDARFVNVFSRQADVGGARRSLYQTFRLRTFANGSYLATLLRRVVFVGETALCASFDFKGVGLRAI